MKYLKIAVLLLVAFSAGGAIAFFFGGNYHELVRHFFVTSTDGNIHFPGKRFPDMPNATFILSFATYICITTWCLYKQKWNWVLLYLLIMAILFFGATYLTSSIDAIGRMAQCTACNENEKALRNNNIDYNFHLLVSLLVSILPIARLIPKNKFA